MLRKYDHETRELLTRVDLSSTIKPQLAKPLRK